MFYLYFCSAVISVEVLLKGGHDVMLHRHVDGSSHLRRQERKKKEGRGVIV